MLEYLPRQLSFVQVVNTLVGRTTSERFGFKAKTNQSTEEEEAAPVMVGSTISSDHQPYSQLQNRPFYRNIIDMLFVNAYVPEFGAKALQ